MKNFDISQFAKSICKDDRTLEMFRSFVNNAYIRNIEYYAATKTKISKYREDFKLFSEKYSSTTLSDMDSFFEEKRWIKDKPGIILCFIGNDRAFYDVIYPLLEEYGLTGWFFISPEISDIPAEKQFEYAKQHDFVLRCTDYRDGERLALSWEEIQEISEKHEICCESFSNVMIKESFDERKLEQEICASKTLLEKMLNKSVRAFHWQASGDFKYNLTAHVLLEKSGYEYVLSNLRLEKLYKRVGMV